MVKNRPKRMQYRPELTDAFFVQTGLTLNPTRRNPSRSRSVAWGKHAVGDELAKQGPDGLSVEVGRRPDQRSH